MRIDLHTHLIPAEYVAEVRRVAPDAIPPIEWSRERALETMARYEIDAAVLSLSQPGVFFGDQGQASELARTVNEEAAAAVRSDPASFGALACLPLPDVDAALDELAYALDVLELDGVALLSNVGGTYLGDRAWDPLFDELDRRGAYVFVHPGGPPYAPPVADHPPWLYEFLFDTTRAIVHLVYSGTLERCPNVKLQFAHMGGTVPFVAQRIEWAATRRPDLAEHAPAGAAVYLERLWLDTASSDRTAAVYARRLDRIVFGSDWPFVELPREGGDPAPGLAGLSAGDRARIDGLNAAGLVPRLAGAR